MTNQVNLLNISIDNITMLELLEKLKFGGVVFTPNVDHLVKLQENQEFYSVYQEADYIVCDSQILMYISRFLGTPIQEKISGSDLFPAFYMYYRNNHAIKIFLLGGFQETANQAKEKINSKAGRNIIIDTYSPPFGFENDEQECQKIIELINHSSATVLAIGVGAPKQELWIHKNKHQLTNVKIFLAIGATINFETGNVKRSPRWMSKIGLEWLYRLISEPHRLWKRYLVDDLPFFWLVLKQKFSVYHNPWSQVKQYK
ncbi:acetyl-mannosamine transferase [Dulcicalothrix desertica PCC 7102]|uniref:Acetyl-mannosamine transferase n=1 Tax=Dulcicalothrix desertica PCC 7102 TaxID=232991 RepID=A0A3S1AIW2_9CYAN|nr:WecB/TagA/CpsF family glycosyltransferase [Dulcicalothrix desertica]RUT01896.1 acetyl-mannosamine transferase [Dulcicalothrix desertica PCC 7102]